MANLKFTGGGRVYCPVEKILASPKMQEQVKAVRELAKVCGQTHDNNIGILLKGRNITISALRIARKCLIRWGGRWDSNPRQPESQSAFDGL